MPAVSLETLTILDSSSARSASSSWQLTRYNRRLISYTFRGADDLQRELSKSSWGELLLKKLDDYDGPALAISSSWVQVGRGSDAVYIFDLLLDSEEIDAAFAESSDPIDCILELNFSDGGRPGTVKMPAILENRYRLPTEGIPAGSTASYPAAGAVALKTEVEALSDSMSAKLNRSELGEAQGAAPLNSEGKLDGSFIDSVPADKIVGYIEKEIILGPGLGYVEDGTTITIYLTALDYGTTPP